jgi:hypothetical protein
MKCKTASHETKRGMQLLVIIIISKGKAGELEHARNIEHA